MAVGFFYYLLKPKYIKLKKILRALLDGSAQPVRGTNGSGKRTPD